MDNENQDVEVEKTNEEVENNQDNAGKVEEDKAAKTVEKLQKRLGKLTGDKHDLEEELANTKAELEAYKSGKKTVKKLSEEDKAKQAQDAKDKELESLRAELARTKALSETSDVLKEQDLNVSADVLNMVVSLENDIIVYRNDMFPGNLKRKLAKFLSTSVVPKATLGKKADVAIIIPKNSNGGYIELLANDAYKKQREYLINTQTEFGLIRKMDELYIYVLR